VSNIDLSLAGVPRTKNGLIMPTGVVFYYLHRADGSAGGCVCLGAVVGKKPVRHTLGPAGRPVQFCRGISFCSRKDRFSRATGRELAYRRFLLAVSRKKNDEPIRRIYPRSIWGMSNCKSCFDAGVLTGKEEKIWRHSKSKPATKAVHLTAMDRHELKAAGSPRGALPRLCDGTQSHLQWRSWQKLQRAGLAVIEGSLEAECLRLPAAKAKGKRT
jgi:hypothetical protein